MHIIIDIIVNPFQSNFEKGMFTCGIFIDFEKAFATVYHNILLKKFNCCSSYNPDEVKTFCQIQAPGLLM